MSIKVEKRGRRGGQTQRDLKMLHYLVLNTDEGHKRKNAVLLEAGKGKNTDSSLDPPSRRKGALTTIPWF